MEDKMNISRTKTFRKHLRNEGTPAEAVLWRMLKEKQVFGLKFRRQHSVESYILDFYCPSLHLAIELDGEVHTVREDYDEKRTMFLNKEGIYVLRFENRVVFENPQTIIDEIQRVMKSRVLPTTSPCGDSSFQKEES